MTTIYMHHVPAPEPGPSWQKVVEHPGGLGCVQLSLNPKHPAEDLGTGWYTLADVIPPSLAARLLNEARWEGEEEIDVEDFISRPSAYFQEI